MSQTHHSLLHGPLPVPLLFLGPRSSPSSFFFLSHAGTLSSPPPRCCSSAAAHLPRLRPPLPPPHTAHVYAVSPPPTVHGSPWCATTAVAAPPHLGIGVPAFNKVPGPGMRCCCRQAPPFGIENGCIDLLRVGIEVRIDSEYRSLRIDVVLLP